MRRLASIALAALLAGCSSVSQVASGNAVRPVSEQPITTEARGKAKIHVDLGMAYLSAGRLGVALDEAKLAAGYDSGYAPAYHLAGLVNIYLEEPATARINFEQALKLAPGDPEIANSYGWFLCLNGQDDEGLKLLAAAARNPYYQTPTRPYTNAGMCYLKRKDDASAEAQFLRAIQADPANPKALYHLGEITYRRGAFEASRRYLAELHGLTEPSAESLWLALRVARRLGDRQGEAAQAVQLRRRFPGSPEFKALMQGQYE
ncbi:MAG: type IV pilus biogenesis/stability protein PilW [Zoogloea sp.]|nr:type IV pilus biogenesis/stability protein PilW [Zoogloea sp.]